MGTETENRNSADTSYYRYYGYIQYTPFDIFFPSVYVHVQGDAVVDYFQLFCIKFCNLNSLDKTAVI